MIQQLPEHVINKIAAGEVIENPAAILRELLDNSIDAKSDEIEVTLDLDADFKIVIKDNGIGIAKEQLPLAFNRYATSKLKEINEIYQLNYLGFRGEALASIAAISKVTMDSCQDENGEGNRITIRGGKVEEQISCSSMRGTKITISEIFYNTPVRKKFLKSMVTEQSNIKIEVIRHVLSTNNIGFRYQIKKNGKVKNEFNIAKNLSFRDKICFFFRQINSDYLVEINYSSNELDITGYVTNHKYRAKTKRHQYLMIKNRIVKNNTFSAALDSAYINILPSKTFSASFLRISSKIENFIDINIHPSKKEAKFQDNRIFYHHIHQAVKEQLYRFIYKSQSESLQDSLETNFSKENYQQENNFKSNNTRLELNDFVQKKNPTRELQEKKNSSYFANAEENMEQNLQSNLQKDFLKYPFKENALKANQVKENQPIEKNDSAFHDNLGEANQQQVSETIVEQIREQIEVLGQVAKSYIVFFINKDLFIADQHAVHERINFDNLQKNFKNQKITQQYLLTPLVIRRSKIEIESLLEYRELFSKIGFEIDKFSKENIQVERVPSFIKENKIKFVMEALADIILDNPSLEIEQFFEKTLSTIACRMSIMSGDVLSKEEMKELILTLYKKDHIYNCPHGRPFVKKISFQEMSNFFERGAHLPGL